MQREQEKPEVIEMQRRNRKVVKGQPVVSFLFVPIDALVNTVC